MKPAADLQHEAALLKIEKIDFLLAVRASRRLHKRLAEANARHA